MLCLRIFELHLKIIEHVLKYVMHRMPSMVLKYALRIFELPGPDKLLCGRICDSLLKSRILRTVGSPSIGSLENVCGSFTDPFLPLPFTDYLFQDSS